MLALNKYFSERFKAYDFHWFGYDWGMIDSTVSTFDSGYVLRRMLTAQWIMRRYYDLKWQDFDP